jgi:hypothetical protein
MVIFYSSRIAFVLHCMIIICMYGYHMPPLLGVHAIVVIGTFSSIPHSSREKGGWL